MPSFDKAIIPILEYLDFNLGIKVTASMSSQH